MIYSTGTTNPTKDEGLWGNYWWGSVPSLGPSFCVGGLTLTAAAPTTVSSTTGSSSGNILMFINTCRDGNKLAKTTTLWEILRRKLSRILTPMLKHQLKKFSMKEVINKPLAVRVSALPRVASCFGAFASRIRWETCGSAASCFFSANFWSGSTVLDFWTSVETFLGTVTLSSTSLVEEASSNVTKSFKFSEAQFFRLLRAHEVKSKRRSTEDQISLCLTNFRQRSFKARLTLVANKAHKHPRAADQ